MQCKFCASADVIITDYDSVQCKICDKGWQQSSSMLQFQPNNDNPYGDLDAMKFASQ